MNKKINQQNDPRLELALEGERLCRIGNCEQGVKYLEAAIEAGISDQRTLTAVHGQLGNAYFILQDYAKSLEYHKLNLTVARNMGDRQEEAKASGNVGNTLKVLGDYEGARACCQRYLDISQELGDQVNEARALYSLGNVVHARGKHFGKASRRDPGEYPAESREALETAITYYEANLDIVRKLNDKASLGRTCGNLGNTHYLLGNFRKAITYHEERLSIAKEFGDLSAERRACNNLGNAYMFLGDFKTATELYKNALELAQKLNDRALEAQACYSLGNTYTLLREFDLAIEYHTKHLRIARELKDRVGEGKACWSLSNVYSSIKNTEMAIFYANQHKDISKEKQLSIDSEEENFFDLLSKFQSRRIDDQRCSSSVLAGTKLVNSSNSKQSLSSEYEDDDKENQMGATGGSNSGHFDLDEEFVDMIVGIQGLRMNDQRAEFGGFLPPTNRRHVGGQYNRSSPSHSLGGGSVASGGTEATTSSSDDQFFEMLMKCQGARFDNQRTVMPNYGSAPTVPDEDFLNLIQRFQCSRLEEQRSWLPPASRSHLHSKQNK